jgi:hypothetical protein
MLSTGLHFASESTGVGREPLPGLLGGVVDEGVGGLVTPQDSHREILLSASFCLVPRPVRRPSSFDNICFEIW